MSLSTSTTDTDTNTSTTQYKKIKPITDSKSLFRNLLNAAIEQNLRQNEFKVFCFLLNKTLGYGKRSDRLTTGVIAKSSGIRKDHAKKAIAGLLRSGLFDRKKSRQYEYRYTIGEKFLRHFDGIFFTPALPKFGNSLRKLEGVPENWEHTDLYLNNSLPKQILPRAATPTIVINLDLEGDEILTKERRCGRELDINNFQPSLASTMPMPIPDKLKTATPIKQSQWSWKESGLDLPSSIEPINHNFCINILKRGSTEEARNTLSVYNDLQDKGLVRNPPLLLKKLAKLSILGELALPQANVAAVVNKPFIPAVPNTLDDRLMVYAKKHDFSEAPSGFGYIEYRSLLKRERKARLIKLEQEAAHLSANRVKETTNTPSPQEQDYIEEVDEHLDMAQAADHPITLFNEMLSESDRTGRTVQDIALERGLQHVLETLDCPLDADDNIFKFKDSDE